MKASTLMGLALVLLYACHTENHKNQSSDTLKLTDTLSLEPNAPLLEKLVYQTVEQKNYVSEFRTSGTVQAMNGKLAEITVPFSGRITRIHARLGQHIQAGGIICELSSAEYYEATKAYFQALAQNNQAEKQYKRQQDLLQHGVGSQKDLELMEAEYERAKSEYEQAAAQMQLFHADLRQLRGGQALRMVSPIDGEVVQLRAILGQYLKEDAAAIAVVANLSKVWVVAKVKEKFIRRIQKNDKAYVQSEANGEEKMDGKILHIGELVDPESRCIEVLVECNNPQRKLKPGMFARVDFASADQRGLVLPTSAILQSEQQSFVYVKTAPNTFVKRSVKVESLSERSVVITEGLREKEIVVSDGGIYLMDEQ